MTQAVLPNPSAPPEWLLASLTDRALNWVRAHPLDGVDGDEDADTGTDTTILDDDDIASLASQQSTSLQHSSLQSCPFAPLGLHALSLMFPGGLELDALFEDHGVCSAVIAGSLALERTIYRRCALVQPPLSALQLANRRKSALLLTDLVAAFALPPLTGGFTLQVLDMAHTWSDRSDNDIDLNDILALVAAVYMFIRMDPCMAAAATVSPRASRTAHRSCRASHQAQPHNAPALPQSEDSSAGHPRRVSHPGNLGV